MLAVIVLFLSHAIALYFALLVAKDRVMRMGRFLGIMAGLTVLSPALNLAVVAFLGPGNGYEGVTQSRWECTRWEYLAQQADYATFLMVMFNILWIGLLALMCITNLTLRDLDTRQA